MCRDGWPTCHSCQLFMPNSWTFMISVSLYLINIYWEPTVCHSLSLVQMKKKENRKGNSPRAAYILRQFRKSISKTHFLKSTAEEMQRENWGREQWKWGGQAERHSPAQIPNCSVPVFVVKYLYTLECELVILYK